MNIFEQYGIKEVADVMLYRLEDINGKTEEIPYLYLDTLKVSTLEQTAEQTEARGGKGNSPLIIWDFGKEINVTLEDALYTPRSMSMVWGGGKDWSSLSKTISSVVTTEIDNPIQSTYKIGNIITSSDNVFANGQDENGKVVILINSIPKDLEITNGIIPNEYINQKYIEPSSNSFDVTHTTGAAIKIYTGSGVPEYPGDTITQTWEDFSGTINDIAFGTSYVLLWNLKAKVETEINVDTQNNTIKMSRIINTDNDGYFEDLSIYNPSSQLDIKILNGSNLNPAISPDSPEKYTFEVYDSDSKKYTAQTLQANQTYFIEWEQKVSDNSKKLEVKADDFAGTYKLVGDTYARNRETGKDEFFQFTINRAKMSADNTLTLEAEGEPTVFNLNMRVLRPKTGSMIEFIQYKIGE